VRGIRRALHSSESADLLTVKVQFLTFGQHAEDINRVSFHRESDAQLRSKPIIRNPSRPSLRTVPRLGNVSKPLRKALTRPI